MGRHRVWHRSNESIPTGVGKFRKFTGYYSGDLSKYTSLFLEISVVTPDHDQGTTHVSVAKKAKKTQTPNPFLRFDLKEENSFEFYLVHTWKVGTRTPVYTFKIAFVYHHQDVVREYVHWENSLRLGNHNFESRKRKREEELKKY